MGNLFFPKKKPETLSKEAAEAHILAHRFEGQSSIEGVSTLMKRFNIPYSSAGYISQYLTHAGKMLSNTLEKDSEGIQFIAFADDEVFSKSSPILMTVDPISSAI